MGLVGKGMAEQGSLAKLFSGANEDREKYIFPPVQLTKCRTGSRTKPVDAQSAERDNQYLITVI